MGEVRLGLRLIVKQPILSATIILALATGICFATMGFTLRDEIVNAKLPYAGGERFGRLEAQDKDRGRIDLDPERYHAFRDRATSFEHLGAFGARPFTLTHNAKEVESIRGAVHHAAIDELGRSVTESGPQPHSRRCRNRRRAGRCDPGEPVAATLQRRSRHHRPAADNRRPAPHRRRHHARHVRIPLESGSCGCRSKKRRSAAATSGIGTAVRVFGVLRAGVTFEQATTEVNALSQQIPSATLRVDEMRVRFRPFAAEADAASLAASALVGVLVMVLLVVASNVATLVFARTWSRAPELAVRTALGAPRSRVVGQLFLETLLLGSIAAVIGMAGSYAVAALDQGFARGLAFYITLSPNPRIVLFVVVLTLLVSAVSGLLPALRVTRHDLRNTLYGGRGFAFGGFGKVGALIAGRRDRVVGRAPQRRRDDGARVQRVLRRDPGAAEESDSDRAAWPHSIA